MAAQKQSLHIVEKILMLLTGLLGLTLVALGVFGNNGIITYTQLRRNYREMEQRVGTLEKENRRLAEEIVGLRDDPFLIEKIARDELGMIKPGEVLYHVRLGGKQ